MFFAEKRIKLSNESSINKNKKKSNSSAADSSEHGIESGYHSQVDFTNSTADFSSLSSVKRKNRRASQVSFQQANKQSFDLADLQQTSSGYSSLLSSTSSPRKSLSRTPTKKRKLETDENDFHNLHQFVSPSKVRKKDPSDDNNKRAKLILKEKSSSENVILSSTPIRSSNDKGKWGKFRSLHPERFEIGKALEEVEPFEKISTLSNSIDGSFSFGASFDFNSFELSNNSGGDHNIPSTVQQLWTQAINIPSSVAKSRAEPTETATKSQEQNVLQTTSNISSSSRTYYHCGRLKMDILGKLHDMDNLALKKILGHLSDIDLLSISHVSKNYKHMIKSDKKLDLKRQSYLKAQRRIKENRTPGGVEASFIINKPKLVEQKPHKRPFDDSNINHSMQLRSKPQSPPVSPSRKRFHENQKVAQSHKGLLKKCPRCFKPAKINSVRIRSSPRKSKKKNCIMKISVGSTGRVHKTFLSKPAHDSLCTTEQLYATFPGLLDEHSSSSCSSPGSPSSDESCGSSNEIYNDSDIYEYGICSGISCNFKFCVKCNCKYHPRQLCKELAPASPSRNTNANKSVACSSQSLKSLKRLIY